MATEKEHFSEITEKLLDTFSKKNHDYGNSFEQSMNKYGLIASVIRLGDKMNRFENLLTVINQVEEESIKDTLYDMANYVIMTIMWLEKRE